MSLALTDEQREAIMFGTMLAVDPSSGSSGSKAGWALYEKGELVDSGVAEVNHRKPIDQRLADLYDFFEERFNPDVLVIEKIRGFKAHVFLLWSVGVTMSSVRADYVVEVHTSIWKKYTKFLEHYVKGDEEDAIAIGYAAVREAGQ